MNIYQILRKNKTVSNTTQKEKDIEKLQEVVEFLNSLQKREWVKETGKDFIVAQQAEGIKSLIIELPKGY